jgi:RNA polymerase sigma-70 factor (ECF subfamily)
VDKQLDGIDIRSLRAGDKEAVRRWFERYADPLYTLVFHRVGGDDDTALDIVQETFLAALEKIEDYDPGRGSMFAWLSCVSRNCIKRTLREKGRSASYHATDSELDGTLLEAYLNIETQPLPEEVIERAETAELVRIALGSIPAHYATVLRQYYYQQSSVGEISKLRDLGEGAVRALLHRARAAFKEAFLQLVNSAREDSMHKGRGND